MFNSLPQVKKSAFPSETVLLTTLDAGLVLLVSLLGHPRWHAYRDLLHVSALPEQEQR